MSEKKNIQPHEHVPNDITRAKVIAFICAGYPQEDIAKYLGISDDTLRKHYPDEIEKAKIENIADISSVAYKLAREGNEKMIQFVLRCQARWSHAKAPEDLERDAREKSLMEKLIDKL